jgi:hypothetical protein
MARAMKEATMRIVRAAISGHAGHGVTAAGY